MTAPRAAIQKLLSEDEELQGLGFGAVYAANTLDNEAMNPLEAKFLVVRWENTTPAFSTRGSTACNVWAHDRNPDYGDIAQALLRVRELILSAVHLEGEDGVTLTTSTWTGEGPDLKDDIYHTVVRWSGFNVVGRGTIPPEVAP